MERTALLHCTFFMGPFLSPTVLNYSTFTNHFQYSLLTCCVLLLVPYRSLEDAVAKYGNGRWAEILLDPAYKQIVSPLWFSCLFMRFLHWRTVFSCFELFLIGGICLFVFAEVLTAAFILICTMSPITYNRADTFLSTSTVRRTHERELEGQVPQHVQGKCARRMRIEWWINIKRTLIKT
jgi:hypothetical protein